MKFPSSYFEFQTDYPLLNNVLVTLAIATCFEASYMVEPGVIKMLAVLVGSFLIVCFTRGERPQEQAITHRSAIYMSVAVPAGVWLLTSATLRGDLQGTLLYIAAIPVGIAILFGIAFPFYLLNRQGQQRFGRYQWETWGMFASLALIIAPIIMTLVVAVYVILK